MIKAGLIGQTFCKKSLGLGKIPQNNEIVKKKKKKNGTKTNHTV